MSFTYLKRSELNAIPDLEPMIDGVIDKGTVVMLAAQPGAGKSFLAIDWACSYATGKPWQGRETSQNVRYIDDRPAKGKSLYIAAEGARGMKSRVSAWEQAWKTDVPDDQLITMPHGVQLGNQAQVAMLCGDLDLETAGLVVIDTLARCSVGLEENSATDMARVIEAAYTIRNAMGPDGTVLLIHHLGKSGEVRGSSALHGGVDQLMVMKRDGDDLELTDAKRKDAIEMEPLHLHLAKAHDSRIIESAGRLRVEGNPVVEAMRKIHHVLPQTRTDLLKNVEHLSVFEANRALSDGLESGEIVNVSHNKTPYFHLGTKGSR